MNHNSIEQAENIQTFVCEGKGCGKVARVLTRGYEDLKPLPWLCPDCWEARDKRDDNNVTYVRASDRQWEEVQQCHNTRLS